jgi:hypothetical protein
LTSSHWNRRGLRIETQTAAAGAAGPQSQTNAWDRCQSVSCQSSVPPGSRTHRHNQTHSPRAMPHHTTHAHDRAQRPQNSRRVARLPGGCSPSLTLPPLTAARHCRRRRRPAAPPLTTPLLHLSPLTPAAQANGRAAPGCTPELSSLTSGRSLGSALVGLAYSSARWKEW